MRVHLNIGSNLANPIDNINGAIGALRRWPRLVDPDTLRISRPYYSAPWGFDSTNRFVNVGLSFDTPFTPLQLLDVTQSVEQQLGAATPHRNPDGTYADRIIDIDIIFCGTEVIDTPRLKVPHPLMHLREFVLVPLNETDPAWVHPTRGQSASRLLEPVS